MTALPTPADSIPAPLEPLAVDAKRLASLLCVSIRSVERMDVAGKLPAPLRLCGGHAKRWSVAEIRQWLAAGAPDRRTWNSMKGGVP